MGVQPAPGSRAAWRTCLPLVAAVALPAG